MNVSVCCFKATLAHLYKMVVVLLVVGVAVLLPTDIALASPSMSIYPFEQGVVTVRTERGALIVGTFFEGEFMSRDGGYTWVHVPFSYSWWVPVGRYSMDDRVPTPRGTYSIEGTDVVLKSGDTEEVAYSTEFLQESLNRRQREFATRRFGDRVLTSGLHSIAHDETSGSVVVPLGLEGVLVGDRSGNWRRVSVGPYSPTDFSVVGKVRLVFREPGLWLSALALSVSLAAAVLILTRVVTPGGWVRGILLAVVVILPSALTIDPGGIWVTDTYLHLWRQSAPALSTAFVVAALTLPRATTFLGWLGGILLVAVGLTVGWLGGNLIVYYPESVGIQSSLVPMGMAVLGMLVGIPLIVPSVPRLSRERHLPLTIASLWVIVALIALASLIAMSYFYMGHATVYLMGLMALSIFVLRGRLWRFRLLPVPGRRGNYI